MLKIIIFEVRWKHISEQDTTMKKAIIILGLLWLIIFGGLYAKRKFHGPEHRLDNAKIEVKELVDNDEIKNGDLISDLSFWTKQSHSTGNKIKIFSLRAYL